MKEDKIVQAQSAKIFIAIFVITCIIFIPFLSGHYATDTYNIANIGYREYAINWSLKDGRIFMAIIGLIAYKINLPIESYVFITLFIALIISNITVILLSKIIKKYKNPNNKLQETILLCISYITIFNFMYLEDMYFVESVVMSASILLFLISANILVQRNKNYIIKSLILIITGIMCYQGTVGMFFAFVILFTILKNKNNFKQVIIDMIKCGIIAFISVLLNIIMVKIIGNIFGMQQNRLGNVTDIFKNIRIIINNLPNILQETCNLFPKNMLLIFISILTAVIIIYQIKKIKEKRNLLYKYIAIVVVVIAGSMVTYILTLTSFYTGRLRNALGALVGIIFIFIYVETDLFEKNGKINVILCLTFVSYVIINIINYENIMIQHKQVNILEKKEINILEKYVEEYENSTGINVDKIVILPILDNMEKAYFENVKNKTSFTHNALRTSWAADGAINFYTNRKLKKIELTEEKQELYDKIKEDMEYQCIEDIIFVKIYMY